MSVFSLFVCIFAFGEDWLRLNNAKQKTVFLFGIVFALHYLCLLKQEMTFRTEMNQNILRLLPLLLLMGVALAGSLSCGSCSRGPQQDTTAWDYKAPPAKPVNRAITGDSMGLISNAEIHRLPSYIEQRPLNEIFTDNNALQLEAAEQNGFKPVSTLRDAYCIDRPLIRIYSCDAYMLDDLTASVPYLVPKAAQLLKEIGYAFQDSIRQRGGKAYRIKVTSVTRTDFSVSKLMRRNRAATENSCHRYGTTFDISWVKFDCLDPSMVVSLEDLKNILAEVVLDFRSQGRCYAIFERRSGCLHITVR